MDNLLKWTKSQLGKLAVVPQMIDIAELTDGVIEVMRPVAAIKILRYVRKKEGIMRFRWI